MYNSLLYSYQDIGFIHNYFLAIEEIALKMKSIKHKFIILSGKGGVGKTTFTAHLAHCLASDSEKQVSY